ncbi:MAG: hypothetical protein PHX27_03260 [Candidatus ainarchaeum sp.]|nr:hypothetical protein [Candidatus ainarchaeum sp.]
MKSFVKNFYKNMSLVLIGLFLISIAFSFPVNAPSEIEVNSIESFFLVEITNPYDISKEVTVNFFAPTDIQVSFPKTISPNSTIVSKIFIRNDFFEFTKINSTLEVYLDNELEKREISIRFHPVNNQNSFENGLQNFNPIEGLFAFALLFNMENFVSMEFALTFFLILISLALLVMLVVRISRGA